MRAGMAGWVSGMVLLVLLPALPAPWMLYTSAALGTLLCLCRHFRPRRGLRASRLLACFSGGLLLAIALSGLRGHALLQAELPAHCNRQTVTLEGVVSSLPAVTEIAPGLLRRRFSFRVEQSWPQACAAPRHVLLSYFGAGTVAPGQRWRFEARLKHPWGLANPGSFNVQSWYAGSGVHATGSVRGEGQLLAEAVGARVLQLRQRLATAIQHAGMSDEGAAILRAVTVGDKSAIGTRLWQLCQQLGINHLMVISGLHVAMVAGTCLVLGRLPGLMLQLGGWPLAGARAPVLCALAGACCYSALAGFALPCLRALCMLAAFLAARMVWRRNTPASGLLLAACAILALQPLALLGSGFWLSFGAVAGLTWLLGWQSAGAWWSRALRAHSLMAGLMLPAGALWFGGASLVAIPANFLMVPLVGSLVVPIALLGVLAWLCGASVAPLLWQLAARPLEALLAGLAGNVTDAALFVTIAGGAGAALLSLVGSHILVAPVAKQWRLAALTLLLPLAFPARPLDPRPALHVLDVGQGSAVVYTHAGRTLLYDTGDANPAGASLARSVVLPWLRVHGIRRLDEVVISHGDSDHSGGLADILGALPVARLRIGAGTVAGVPALPCRRGDEWQWPEGSRFRLLSPPAELANAGNDGSCVLQIDAPGLRVLLPGDISAGHERALILRWGTQLQSDVLLAAHHGSASSSAQSWLNHVDPAIAIVSAGYASRFGHPAGEVMQRFQAQGVRVHQTALEGALTVRPEEGGGFSVEAWRERGKRWWK